MRHNLKRGLLAVALLSCTAVAFCLLVPLEIVVVAAPGLVAVENNVNPNQPLMLIVPETSRMIVEVQISSVDIDEVFRGQPVRVRFPSFNQRTTPEVKGQLYRITTDAEREPRTGSLYYTGTVTLDEVDVAKLTAKGLTLVIGTPVDAFIKPAPRTIAKHLLRPWRFSYRHWPINRDRFERVSRRDSSLADRS